MSPRLFDLSGKTALVTGSTSGIGLALARGLAEAGASLVLHGRNATKVNVVASDFAHGGHTVTSCAFDVTDEAAILEAFACFDADGTHIDILVNNAGIQHRRPMLELSTADWKRVVDTNLTSAFVIGREAARRMKLRGGGKIINIGSLMSEVARATVAPYTAAKGGLKLLTRSMTAEWAGYNIQANAIGPGYILTQLNAALIADDPFDAWVRGRTPSGRWGAPDELVGAAVFLGSRASDYVNGQMIFIDGGMLAVL
jgi:gluconate 5-dehydrogenase